MINYSELVSITKLAQFYLVSEELIAADEIDKILDPQTVIVAKAVLDAALELNVVTEVDNG